MRASTTCAVLTSQIQQSLGIQLSRLNPPRRSLSGQICIAASIVFFVTGPCCAHTQVALHWATNYTSGSGYDVARDAMLDASGNVYIAGDSRIGTNDQTIVLKYSAGGALIWSNYFSAGFHGGRMEVKGAALDPSGDLHVVAEVQPDGSDADIRVLKVRSDGSLVWSNTLNLTLQAIPDDDSARSVAADAAGNTYVVGTTTGTNYFRQACVLKFNPDGVPLWTNRFATMPESHHLGKGLAIDSAGNAIFVTADIYNGIYPLSLRYAFMRLSTDGVSQWVRYSDEEATPLFISEPPRHVLIGGDAGIYFTGRWKQQPAVWKYDSSGTQVWLSRYAGPPLNINNFAHFAAVDLFGNVTWVADRLTVRFDRTGVVAWSARAAWSGPGVVALDNDQNALVRAGILNSITLRATNFVLTRFEADGSRRWTFDSPTPQGYRDIPVALLVTNHRVVTVDTYQEADGLFGADTEILAASYTHSTGGLGPRIVSLSKHRSVWVGTNVTLNVEAEGAPSMNYQWYFHGEDLYTRTNQSVELMNPGPSAAGAYWVQVSDSAGTTISAETVVEVLTPPADQETYEGGHAFFAVRPAVTLPQSMQWFFNSIPIPGATNSGLSITNAQAADAGVYEVEVVDAFGESLHASARLYVTTQVRADWVSYHPEIEFGSLGIVPDGHGNLVVGTHRGTALFTAGGALSNWVTWGGLFAVAPDDSVYTYGSYSGGGLSADRLVKFSPGLTGLEWNISKAAEWYLDPVAMIAGADDLVYVGYEFLSSRTSSDRNHRVIRQTGTNQPVVLLQASTYTDERLLDVKVYPDGGVVALANHVNGFGPYTAANVITRVTTNGAPGWQTNISTTDVGLLTRLAIDGSGNVIAIGTGNSPYDYNCCGLPLSPHGGNYSLLKLDSTGNRLWSRRFYGSTNRYAAPAALILDGEEPVVTGDAGTVKFDSNGIVRWASSTKGQHIAMADTGTFYVARTITNASSLRDMEVSKLDPGGATVWKAVFNRGEDTDDILAGVYATNGSVFVAGNSDDKLIVLRFTETGASGPQIELTPSPAAVPEGGTLSLTATASGTPLTYRWFFNDQPIAGQTNTTLTIPNFGADMAGGYSVAMRSATGSAESPQTWASRSSHLDMQHQGTQLTITFDVDGWFLSQLQASSNLAAWTPVMQYQGTSGPVNVTLRSTNGPQQFYRLQVTR